MDNQPKETFEISVSFGNTLLQYLGGRPYIEVSGLIQKLQMAASLSLTQQPAPSTAETTNEDKEDEQ